MPKQQQTTLEPRAVSLLLIVAVLLAGCGGRAYLHEPLDLSEIRARAETQTEGPVRVTASVLSREEAEAIFGIDLYDDDIQPVWLEIENSGSGLIRYAPVSTDRFYFPPFEIAYKNRRGYSDEARGDMEEYLHELAMPRYIDPQETRSGFVFTHADAGAKGFNVDVFGTGDYFNFTFVLRVPGFVPDYANIDFDSIYADDEFRNVARDDLLEELRNFECCSSDESGDDREGAVNLILVSQGPEILSALLRSDWVETSQAESADRQPAFFFGRQQDAIFRHVNRADGSFYEMRLWLAPIQAENQDVWAVQVRHYFLFGGTFERPDPDVDNARNFAVQSFIYGQALAGYSMLFGEEIEPVESFWENLIRPRFFSDGGRSVVLLSREPVSMLEVRRVTPENFLDLEE